MSNPRTDPSSYQPGPKRGWRWQLRANEQQAGVPIRTAAPPPRDLAGGLLRIYELAGRVTFTLPHRDEGGSGGPSELHEMAAGLLQIAVEARASDLLIEPGVTATHVRLRRDGLWEALVELPASLHVPLVEALLTDPPGAGSALGIIEALAEGELVRFRFSALQSVHGPHLSIRVPDPHRAVGLHRLGLFPDALAALDRILSRPSGLLVVSGPPASGRTSTLYALLKRLKDRSKHLMTLEEPVEWIVSGVTQIERDPAQCEWSEAIRDCLRHAPDVLMAGDPDQDALVSLAEQGGGSLFLTAAAAPSAMALVERLCGSGLPRRVLAGVFAGAMNQRLVRRLCESCKQPSAAARELASSLAQSSPHYQSAALDDSPCYRSAGCEACRNSGYRGQIGLFEVLEGTPAIRDAIARDRDFDWFEELAVREGMRPLLVDGLRKVAAGVTSVDEVIRALGLTVPGTGS